MTICSDMKTRFYKITIPTLLLAGFGLNAQAQKVTDLQEVSISAPHSIKVDGKNFEWEGVSFSENKRTNISYLICNDDKNLYLVVKSKDIGNNTKIMAGGITFSVNPDGKKKEKESITLTYPLVNRGNMRGGGDRRGMVRVVGGAPGGGGTTSVKQRDSMMAAMQKTQLSQVKEIKISRFKNTADTLVSIYNEYGIKAFGNIEKDNSFFCEMAIPLEALGLTKDSTKEFAYNIKLNGLQMPGLDGGGFGGGGNRGGGGGGGGNRGGGGGGNFGPPRGGGIDFQSLMSPTDFWGKYALVAK